jgi:Tfp pilus assembly protein PilO
MSGKIFVVLITAVLVFTLGAQLGLSKEQEQSSPDAEAIMRKLEQVLSNQEEILKQNEQIKQELAIIKVRASR